MKKLAIIIIILFFFINFVLSNDYKVHQLKEGETLWRISKIYNVTLEEICKLNGIDDVTKVKQGAIVKIPLNSCINSKSETCYKIHVLKKNETLYSLSKIYNISVDELTKLNAINDITKIHSGQILKIPVQLKIKYIDCDLPLKGNIVKFSTSHFEGINIITGSDKNNRYVSSVDKGEVTYIDKIPGYGLTIFIRHSNGLVSTYSCFEEIYVKKNMTVKKNQKIGVAGNLVRKNDYGIIFSLQDNGKYLKFDFNQKKFLKK